MVLKKWEREWKEEYIFFAFPWFANGKATFICTYGSLHSCSHGFLRFCVTQHLCTVRTKQGHQPIRCLTSTHRATRILFLQVETDRPFQYWKCMGDAEHPPMCSQDQQSTTMNALPGVQQLVQWPGLLLVLWNKSFWLKNSGSGEVCQWGVPHKEAQKIVLSGWRAPENQQISSFWQPSPWPGLLLALWNELF